MADLSYEAFKNSKQSKKPSKNNLSYEAFNANRLNLKNVANEKVERRAEGLAVSTSKNRAAPTLGGNIVRGIARPFATLLVRPGQALAAAKGFTEDEQTVKSKYLGDIKTVKNKKDVLKDVGRAAEVLSYGIGVGAVRNAAGQTIKQSGKQIAKNLAVEGTASGLLGSMGASVAEGNKAKKVVKDTVIGAVTGGALGYGIGRVAAPLFNKGAKTIEEAALQRAYGSVDGAPKIPGAGVPSGEYKLKTGQVQGLPAAGQATQEAQKAIELPSPDIAASQRKIAQNLPQKETPIAQQAPVTKQPIPKTQQPIEQTMPTQKVPETQTPEQPKAEVPDNVKEKDAESMADIEGFDKGTFKQWSSEIRNLDMDEITRVALGGKKTIPNTIPNNAYLSIAKNIANETGDLELAQRLATSNVKRKTGQGLVASQLTTSDNIVDDIADIRSSKMRRNGIKDDSYEKEVAELKEKLKTKIQEIQAERPSSKTVDDIINDLICK